VILRLKKTETDQFLLSSLPFPSISSFFHLLFTTSLPFTNISVIPFLLYLLQFFLVVFSLQNETKKAIEMSAVREKIAVEESVEVPLAQKMLAWAKMETKDVLPRYHMRS